MEKKKTEHVTHTFGPVYNKDSEILILGSFPSVKSREGEFYYHHPQNRFWKVLSYLLDVEQPVSIEEKKQLLLKNHIALWDVIESCDICGSSDSSIKNVVPNDIPSLLKQTNIKKIVVNGGKADELYKRYCLKQTEIKAIRLPSTSPANAIWSFERLINEWERIFSD
ncbi:DNA-deoxyinosine glycosylase [Velocimicrobium porci]|uniref:DNA-deoxyinosine glycosylase n=1 Tax=Velocimicrobium porci TaxID=2606634 RepID=A0A6L5XYP7_9FIRM|nr:DNA-deoxyinosine glycosylase [Velocimicrobium porci]MSS63980.1 DNA-deoxyinosine glycosylase [Velocimicrobium porci]